MPKGNGKRPGTPTPIPDSVPQEIEREDTGQISLRMVKAAQDVGTVGAVGAAPIGSSSLLDAVSTKVAEKLIASGIGGNGNGGPPKKTFLGLDSGGWTNTLLGFAVAAVIAVGAWFLWVRDSIRDRPTSGVVEQTIDVALQRHGEQPHSTAKKSLDGHEKQIQDQREQLIRIEGDVGVIKDDIGEIKGDLKRRLRR